MLGLDYALPMLGVILRYAREEAFPEVVIDPFSTVPPNPRAQ